MFPYLQKYDFKNDVTVYNERCFRYNVTVNTMSWFTMFLYMMLTAPSGHCTFVTKSSPLPPFKTMASTPSLLRPCRHLLTNPFLYCHKKLKQKFWLQFNLLPVPWWTFNLLKSSTETSAESKFLMAAIISVGLNNNNSETFQTRIVIFGFFLKNIVEDLENEVNQMVFFLIDTF